MKRFIHKRDTVPIGNRRISDKPPQQYNPRPPQLRKKEPVKFMREIQVKMAHIEKDDLRRREWCNLHETR